MSHLASMWGNVLLKLDEKYDKTPGGLEIPVNARYPVFAGIVKSVGEGRVTTEGKQFPIEVKPGMHVIAARFTGYEIKYDDEAYQSIPDKHVAGYWAEESAFPEGKYEDPRILRGRYQDPRAAARIQTYREIGQHFLDSLKNLAGVKEPKPEAKKKADDGAEFYTNMCQNFLKAGQKIAEAGPEDKERVLKECAELGVVPLNYDKAKAAIDGSMVKHSRIPASQDSENFIPPCDGVVKEQSKYYEPVSGAKIPIIEDPSLPTGEIRILAPDLERAEMVNEVARLMEKYQRKFDGDLSDEELQDQLEKNMQTEVPKPAQHENPRDRYPDGLEQAKPNAAGVYEFIDTNIPLYHAEKDNVDCPEWREYKRYKARGWEIAVADESPTLTLIRRLRREVRKQVI